MRCLVAILAGGTAGQRFSFRAISVAWLLRALGKSYLRITGRRAVCRSTHEGQVKRRTSTLERLARQKPPGLNMRTARHAIQRVIIRCNGRMVISLGNQFALNTLRLNCWGIGQPVKGSSNNQQAQQTCRDLDFQSLVNRSNGPSAKCAAGVHPHSHTLSEFMLCLIGTDSISIPCSSDSRTIMADSLRRERDRCNRGLPVSIHSRVPRRMTNATRK